jgi:hypothetical protein
MSSIDSISSGGRRHVHDFADDLGDVVGAQILYQMRVSLCSACSLGSHSSILMALNLHF